MKRQPFVFVVMGSNGTGKSTFAHKLITKSKQKTLVVTESGMPEIWRQYPEAQLDSFKQSEKMPRVQQVFAMRYMDKKSYLVADLIRKKFTNGLVIFDDCKGYISDNIANTPGLKNLLIDFRHLGLDLCFVVHTPNQLPPQVWAHTKYAFVGKATMMNRDRQNAITEPEKFLETQRIVNEEFNRRFALGNASHYGLFKKIVL